MFPLSAAAPNKLTREISKPNLECPLLALSNKVKLYCEGQSLLRGREIVGIVGTLVVPSNLLASTFSRCFSEWLPRLKIKTSSLEEVLGKEESPGILKKNYILPSKPPFLSRYSKIDSKFKCCEYTTKERVYLSFNPVNFPGSLWKCKGAWKFR